MAAPFRTYIEGTERSSNVVQGSVRITRALSPRLNTAELFISRKAAAAGYYGQPSTLAGVVAWWHMDEASGNLADSGGGAHTLTANGSPGYGQTALALGYGGSSIRFSGNDYFTSTSADFNFTSAFAISLWARVTEATNTFQMFAQRVNAASVNGWNFGINATGRLQFALYNAGVADSVSFVAPYIFGGKGHHFVATVTAARVARLWIDGVEVAQATLAHLAGSAAGQTLYVGSSTASSEFLKGRMDELALTTSPLSATEVADIFAQGRPQAEALHLQTRSQILIKNAAATVTRFGGYAVEVQEEFEDGLSLGWRAKCVGWEQRFQSILVTYTGSNKRTDEVITSVFAADDRLSGYNLTKVRTGKVLDGTYVVRDRPLDEVLDELSEFDQDEWYVDPTNTYLIKQRFNAADTAGHRFSDDTDIDQTTIFPYVLEDFTKNFYNPVSSVVVRGATTYEDWNPKAFGWIFGGVYGWVIPSHGLVPLDGGSEIRVQVNTGTAAVPIWSADLDVGRYARDELIDDGGTMEVLFSPGQQRLFFDSTVEPPRMGANSFRIYGRIAKKIRVAHHDAAAEARLGGNYERLIENDKLTSKNAANAFAKKAIREGSRPLESIALVTDADPDVAATQTDVGELLHFRNTQRGVDTYGEGIDGYLIQQIESWMEPDGNLAHHRLYLGTWQKTPQDKLMELERRLRRLSDFDDDEELDVQIDFGWGGDSQDEYGVITVGPVVWTIV